MTVVLTLVGRNLMVDVVGYERAWFPYPNSTIVVLPMALLTMWGVSVTDRSDRAAAERGPVDEVLVRSELGLVSEPAEVR
jgi:cation/acetate symporter